VRLRDVPYFGPLRVRPPHPLRSMRAFRSVLCLLATAVLLGAGEARAQLGPVTGAEALTAGQAANLFTEWGGDRPLAGLSIEVPEGWRVRAVTAVREGGAGAVVLPVEPLGAGRFAAAAPLPLRGRQRLAVTVEAGPVTAVAAVALTARPERGVPDPPVRWAVAVVEPLPPQNRAFRLGPEAEPVHLSRRALPGLGAGDPLTVELWLRAVGLDEVVLSTWDGDPERPYPLEVVVDGAGRVAVYRGGAGRHEAVVSPAPVADGSWRHVAFVRDPAAGLARLLVDGAAVDSVRLAPFASLNTMPLALGGRPLRPGRTQPRPFTGTLDELRLWPEARPAAAVRRTLRLPLDRPPAGVARFGFDAEPGDHVLARPLAGPVTAASDLAFARPIERFEAEARGARVHLTWETLDRRPRAFVVERSADGQRFEPVAEVARASGENPDGALRFAVADAPTAGQQVVYYRVRQLADGEPERVSGTLKLGLGADDPEAAVAFVGNSPNPFRQATTLAFTVPAPGRAVVTVWDVAGTLVATLLDDEIGAGRHTLRFDAAGLPPGVYFARLQTPHGTAAHRMARTQ